MTLARGTYANDALALAGGANVYADAAGRYPERTPEDARAAGAEAALLPTEPYPFHEKTQAADEIAAAGFPRQRVALVDGEALTWYGVRAVEGLRVVAEAVRRVAVPEGLRA
jgi:ABC-type Fe3+-hydroxamate transport system substrate-binding protein